jgi:plasmid maintenance system antidote protein VapI
MAVQYNYRSFLNEKLSNLPHINHKILADQLKVNRAYISMILGGHRSLSPDFAVRLASILGLDDLQCELLLELVYLEAADHPWIKKLHTMRIGRLRALTEIADK